MCALRETVYIYFGQIFLSLIYFSISFLEHTKFEVDTLKRSSKYKIWPVIERFEDEGSDHGQDKVTTGQTSDKRSCEVVEKCVHLQPIINNNGSCNVVNRAEIQFS